MREIYASDFASGTLRIQTSGHYKLMQDIEFDPCCSDREDMPNCGWFAAISIETCDVVFDFNNCSVKLKPSFIHYNICKYGNGQMTVLCLNNYFKVGNEQFFGYKDDIIYDYCNDPTGYKYKNSENITIINGDFHTSPMNIITGNNNRKIYISESHICDFEVCGICLYKCRDVIIKNVAIEGIKHEQYLRPTRSKLLKSHKTLDEYKWKKFKSTCSKKNADKHIKIILDAIDYHKEYNLAKPYFAANDLYGIHIGQTKENKNEYNKNIIIENVTVSNLNADPKPVKAIKNLNDCIIKAGLVGVIQWCDVFSGSKFKPSTIGKTLAYNELCINLCDKNIDGDYIKALKSIIHDNYKLFVESGYFHKTCVSNDVEMWGTIGVKIENGRNITIKNCEINDFMNIGKKFLDVKMAYKHENIVSTVVDTYKGNDVSGIALICTPNKEINIKNVKVKNLESYNGKTNAVHMDFCNGVIENTPVYYNKTKGTNVCLQ